MDENIRRHRLLNSGARVLLAVSGGLDSVVLLHAMKALAAAWHWHLNLIHVNHGLRGRSSDADERFVCRLAAAADLQCHVRRVSVGAVIQPSESLEMAARRIRHRILAQVSRRHRSVAIALAHHADDQVELFFLRLFRGSGTTGLGGMAWKSPSPATAECTLVRPLLDFGRSELTDYAERQGLKWREDSSNLDCSIPRNKIRHQLIPLLESDYCPALRRVVTRCMEILRVDSEFVARSAKPFNSLPDSERRGLHEALQRALAREDLQLEKQPATFEAVQHRLEEFRGGSTEVHIPDPRLIRFGKQKRRIHLETDNKRFSTKTFRLRWSLFRKPKPFPKAMIHGKCHEQFDAERVGNVVELRHWQPGDRFQPLGFKTPSKLQNLFVNRKIPAIKRRDLWVAANAEGVIFWVEGLPPGEQFKLRPDTRRILGWATSRPLYGTRA
jgi:tRNA(Ile)-lysidine synthase